MKKRMIKIRTKMLFPYLLLILPLIAILSYVQINIVRTQMLDQLKVKTMNEALSTAEVATTPLQIGDFKQLDNVLNQLKVSDSDIKYAVIIDEHNLTVGSSDEVLKNQRWDNTELEKTYGGLKEYNIQYVENPDGDRFYEAVSPIKKVSTFYDENGDAQKKEENIGYIRLGVSIEKISQVIFNQTTLIVIILVVSVIYAIFLFLIAQGIFKSINITLKGFNEISKGHLDEKIDINTRDEIQLLANGFNEMGGQLKESFDKIEKQNEEIRKYNEHLEDLVEERTREIKEKNEVLMNDLKMAQKVQLGIIPDDNTLPKIKDIRFGSKYIALESIGGDMYDVIHLSDRIYGFVIADVSGHGVPAALISTMVKVSFNTMARLSRDTGKICTQVNKEVCNLIGDLEYDLTAFLGIMNLETKELQYTNAAHHPAIIYRGSEKEILRLDTPDTYMGLVNDIEYTTGSVKLIDGDRIILFTDGLVEARNEHEEMYDEDKFIYYIKKHAEEPAKDLVNGLVNDVKKFCGKNKIDDDMAILCIDYSTKHKPVNV